MTTQRSWAIVFICIAAFLLVGFLTAIALSARVDRTERALLLQEAQQAALLVPADVIATLSGSDADLANPVYNQIKNSLSLYRSFNPQLRFVYVLGYKPEIKKQFFYVDSESPSSADYSPPGQIFIDTREQDIDNYIKGIPYTDGPYRDTWGEWISGYAPIKNSQGTVVGLLGVDIATTVWHQQIGFVRTTVGLITVLLSIVAVFILLLFRKKEVSLQKLQLQNTALVQKEQKLNEVQSMARLGKATIYFPEQVFLFDDHMAGIFGKKGEGEKIPFDTVLSFVADDDHMKMKSFMEEIVSSDNLYAWVDVRIGNRELGFRSYHIYGNIERNELLAPIRFSGIMQDITDIRIEK